MSENSSKSPQNPPALAVGRFREAELLDDFESKVKRYLSELDKSSLIGSFGPAANAYFDAAQNLGASLLLRMVVAYRSQQLTDSMQAERESLGSIRPVPADLPARCAELVGDVEVDLAAPLRADLECIADKILEATEENRQLRAQLAKAQDELRATVRQATAMEYAGCDAIAALRAVESNPGLSEAQHALVEEALLGMYAAKPRWLSRPETGRISPKLEGAA